MENEEIKRGVKQAYTERAEQTASSCCTKCGPASCSPIWLYSLEEIKELPPSVINLFAGCGNPVSFADISEGETVLDLGSGGGIDVFLAARRVGGGRVIGVDFSEKTIEIAKRAAEDLGAQNVEFRLGDIENLPIENDSVDVIISNCVINLAPDKERVFQEAYRVLKPSGRIIVSDMVTDQELPPPIREDLNLWSGCIAGAIPERKYLETIEKAGFKNVVVVEGGKTVGAKAHNQCDEVQGIKVYHIIVKAHK